jgi:hypothetical protein
MLETNSGERVDLFHESDFIVPKLFGNPVGGGSYSVRNGVPLELKMKCVLVYKSQYIK